MKEIRMEQKEALETLAGFNQGLVKNMNMIIRELRGERLDDTDNFLEGILNAMNWEIEVMNGTMDLLNDGKERIQKNSFNERILGLAAAVKEKDDEKIAVAIQELIPEFENLQSAAVEILG